MSFHILLLDVAGNNLVNADFSPYSRMFFAVKHIYLTLYIVYTYHVESTYSAPCTLLAPLACPCLRPRVRARCARCPCARVSVLAPVRSRARVAVRPPARSLPADRRACSSARARVRPPARVCAGVCVRGCTRGRACFRCSRHFIRL